VEAAIADVGLTWTEERIELLTKLWTEGLSASQIAAELGEGVSRNAVISKAHRLGIAHGGAKGASTPRPRKPRPPNPAPAVDPVSPGKPTPASMPTTPVAAKEPPAALPEPLPLREEAVAPQIEGVTIMELREGMCRFPLGDPTTPEFRFCGTQAIMGLPYCPYHAQIAYQPATERKRLRA
jgi:GcrA cell cycle regulator